MTDMQNEQEKTANELAELNKNMMIMIHFLSEIHYVLTFQNKLNSNQYYTEFSERNRVSDEELKQYMKKQLNISDVPNTPEVPHDNCGGAPL